MLDKYFLRIGQINFINCLPVNISMSRLGLFENDCSLEYELIDSTPAVLNKMLAQGKLDLAPISSFEYLTNKDLYEPLNGMGISSKLVADSVLFFCDLDFWSKEKKIIHITDKSATSVNLLKIILRDLYKLNLSEIDFVTFKENSCYDAKLLIGDEALLEPNSNYEEIIDLGAKWYELTSLPMVFALWTVNRKSPIFQDKNLFQKVNTRFLELRDKGLNEFYPDMIIEAYKKTGISKKRLNSYFNNLDYGFDERHMQSLSRFWGASLKPFS